MQLLIEWSMKNSQIVVSAHDDPKIWQSIKTFKIYVML